MIRKRPWSLLLCILTGCSTAPLADTLDLIKPGRIGPVTVAPYGGVNVPQGPIVPGAPLVPVIGVPVPIQPVPAVVPPPAPLPGANVPTFPPLPPAPPGNF